MKVAIRADASKIKGAGHVMRCVTLAKSLKQKGVEINFATSIEEVPWLSRYVADAGLHVLSVAPDSLANEVPNLPKFDLLVVDSYQLDSGQISALNRKVPVLAIIDGDNRSIDASIYLDQNLGAEIRTNDLHYMDSTTLFGSKYALVRDEVLTNRRKNLISHTKDTDSKLLIFLGGTDANNYLAKVAELLIKTEVRRFTFIAPLSTHSTIATLMAGRTCEILDFTDNLPELISSHDAVLSAGGTSAWDIATIGTPGGFLCVADNQVNSIAALEEYGIGINLGDITKSDFEDHNFIERIELLFFDKPKRLDMFEKCQKHFDGNGSERVSQEILNFINKRQ